MADLTFVGEPTRRGTYLLRLQIVHARVVVFGRFNGRQPILIPAGECLYVGSALAQYGSATLARRLLRHATRTDPLPPHPIRTEMLTRFVEVGLANAPLLPPAQKTLHWHIDYLLNEPDVTLSHALIIGGDTRLEEILARHLQKDPAVTVITPGLGAGDDPRGTHLLGFRGGDAGWAAICAYASAG